MVSSSPYHNSPHDSTIVPILFVIVCILFILINTGQLSFLISSDSIVINKNKFFQKIICSYVGTGIATNTLVCSYVGTGIVVNTPVCSYVGTGNAQILLFAPMSVSVLQQILLFAPM